MKNIYFLSKIVEFEPNHGNSDLISRIQCNSIYKYLNSPYIISFNFMDNSFKSKFINKLIIVKSMNIADFYRE